MTAASPLIAVILAQLVITVPIIFAIARNYLHIKENELRINERATRDEVQSALDDKIREITLSRRATDTPPKQVRSRSKTE